MEKDRQWEPKYLRIVKLLISALILTSIENTG